MIKLLTCRSFVGILSTVTRSLVIKFRYFIKGTERITDINCCPFVGCWKWLENDGTWNGCLIFCLHSAHCRYYTKNAVYLVLCGCDDDDDDQYYWQLVSRNLSISNCWINPKATRHQRVYHSCTGLAVWRKSMKVIHQRSNNKWTQLFLWTRECSAEWCWRLLTTFPSLSLSLSLCLWQASGTASLAEECCSFRSHLHRNAMHSNITGEYEASPILRIILHKKL